MVLPPVCVSNVDGAKRDCCTMVRLSASPLSHCGSLPFVLMMPSICVPSLALKSPSNMICRSGWFLERIVVLMNE